MSELSIKNLCCTCLSTNRNLNLLCRITDGVNLLYMLLTYDPDAYKQGFYKNTASLYVCWECAAILKRINKFRHQACAVQKQLTQIADGQDIRFNQFSRLKTTTVKNQEITTGFFIDCGIKTSLIHKSGVDNGKTLSSYSDKIMKDDNVDTDNQPNKTIKEECEIKIESDDDIPLSTYSENRSNNGNTENDIFDTGNESDTDKIGEMKLERGVAPLKMKYEKYFTIKLMNEEQMLNYIRAKRKMFSKLTSKLKCVSCILQFKTEKQLHYHKKRFHTKGENDAQCDICQSYVKDINTHRQTHFYTYVCMYCGKMKYTHNKIGEHLKMRHNVMSNRSKPRIKPNGDGKYPCRECEKSFEDKDKRFRHVKEIHRSGYKCKICDKRFSLKSNMQRHERIHTNSIPREECKICHKTVRTEVIQQHMRIHSEREKFKCVECDKSFVSQATYETHLKYSQAHATGDNFKHKCPQCHKGYISKGELRDHINYHHKGEAAYKCHTCGKCFATNRCVRRHFRRAHEGRKENARDKICQLCGKAFTVKQALYEHELIHTGARPLSCAICGRTFRQKSALFTHTKRVHKGN